ncbi:hypothetical protein EDC94DRAFT_243142 [Helicostylum pulchrum]|nr:hypothetical protein EDC94DRAFT_243142 [Helicostylum pulchrum]
MQLIDSYFWNILLKETTDELPEFAKLEELKIKYICDKLNTKLETSPTTFNISKNPENFIPALAFICQETEEEAEVIVEQKEKPKLFSFTPKPSLKWRNISINNKSLASNSGIKNLGNSYSESLEMFDQIFDFKRFGYKSIDDLKNANSTGKDLFACFAQTDGHSISLQFVRKRREKYSETPILALEDFSRTEVEENFLPCTIDPGHKNIYTAAIGHNSKEHQVRRCSDLERRCYTGSRRRQAYVDKLKIAKNIKDIETNIPTAKTVNLETYKVHITYLLEHLPRLLQFYSQESAPFSFYDYQGRQRANAEVANTILNGGKKYNPTKRKNTRKNRAERRKKRKKKEAKLIEDTEKKDKEKYEGAINIKPTTPASDTKAAEPAAVDTKVANPAERQK